MDLLLPKLCDCCPYNRSQTQTLMTPFLRETNQPTTWYPIDCIGLLPAWNSKWCFPYWNWNFSGYWLCFSCVQGPFQHQYQETFGVPYSPSRYSIQYCFWPKNLLQSKRRAVMGLYNLLILLYTSWLRSSCIDRNVECLPEVLDTVPAWSVFLYHVISASTRHRL